MAEIVLAEWEAKQAQSALCDMVGGAEDGCVSGSLDRLLSGKIVQLNFSSDFYFKLYRV